MSIAGPEIVFDCRLERGRFTLDAAFTAGAGITALYGPSGSGKSTVVRLIAGLERAQRGRVYLCGRPVLDTARGINVAPYRRRCGLVFQDAQLFPHLTVGKNLAYGRDLVPPNEHVADLATVVGVLGIGHLLDRAPATLSGGERQRVAIGRAILASPSVLLMDEPLSSLDVTRKLEILPFIERLRDEFAIPILYVTHAIEEVMRLAACVVRLESGRATAIGPPSEVLCGTPAAGGDLNRVTSLLTAEVARHDKHFNVTVLRHPAGEVVVPGIAALPVGGRALLAIPAPSVSIATSAPGDVSIRTALRGRVGQIECDVNGPYALVTIVLDGGDRLRALITRMALEALALCPGRPVHALVKAVTIDGRWIAGEPAAAGRIAATPEPATAMPSLGGGEMLGSRSGQ